MKVNQRYPLYEGQGYPAPGREDSERFPYVADPNLVDAVNMSIQLRRPLLLKGPPGCGKTLLAAAVAHELGHGDRFHTWSVKSTSRARDGLYTLDLLRRLQDAQAGKLGSGSLEPYVQWGGLGEAIRAKAGERSIVLIDEIDKADIDFPNDLLLELDRLEFVIEEMTEAESTTEFPRRHRAPAGAEPIVFITSNDEKELPDAFLRRCLFHWIDFPDTETLARIVRINTRDLDQLDGKLLAKAIEKLGEIRQLEGLRKKPATSELIDWVRILHLWKVPTDGLDVSLAALPGLQALYKHQGDLDRVKRAGSAGSD